MSEYSNLKVCMELALQSAVMKSYRLGTLSFVLMLTFIFSGCAGSPVLVSSKKQQSSTLSENGDDSSRLAVQVGSLDDGTVLFDEDGDGKADSAGAGDAPSTPLIPDENDSNCVSFDSDGDGTPDKMACDTNGDGNPDAMVNPSEDDESQMDSCEIVKCADEDFDDSNDHETKVKICHVPKGNPSVRHTICIGAPALKAHIGKHGGDTVGECSPSSD